ncbi:helix-turn-helix domain-containing protein [Salinithrix halophila]|uniref:Helix-turn-helix domain-containing protein n=1 Tax=Salinithrix halophila TaxID=1485204 RepID=A0ABV8JG43_9BACL
MFLDRLVELRKRKKWSIQETADRLGIPKSTYAGYESGYRRPSLEAITMMADLFETSLDDLMGRAIDSPSPTGKKKNTPPLELSDDISLTIDGQPLSKEEIQQLIAYIRAKRQIEQRKISS